jgi:hypothetical protein
MKDAKKKKSTKPDSLWEFYARQPIKPAATLVTDEIAQSEGLPNEEIKYMRLKEIAAALCYEHDTDHLNAPRECIRCNALDAYEQFLHIGPQ